MQTRFYLRMFFISALRYPSKGAGNAMREVTVFHAPNDVNGVPKQVPQKFYCQVNSPSWVNPSTPTPALAAQGHFLPFLSFKPHQHPHQRHK